MDCYEMDGMTLLHLHYVCISSASSLNIDKILLHKSVVSIYGCEK